MQNAARRCRRQTTALALARETLAGWRPAPADTTAPDAPPAPPARCRPDETAQIKQQAPNPPRHAPAGIARRQGLMRASRALKAASACSSTKSPLDTSTRSAKANLPAHHGMLGQLCRRVQHPPRQSPHPADRSESARVAGKNVWVIGVGSASPVVSITRRSNASPAAAGRANPQMPVQITANGAAQTAIGHLDHFAGFVDQQGAVDIHWPNRFRSRQFFAHARRAECD